jgi:hypothetical protein
VAPVLNPGIVRVRVIGALGTERAENVYHLRRPAGAPWTADVVQSAALAVYQAYEANLLPFLSSTYTLLRTEAVQLAGPGSMQGAHTPAAGAAGAITGDCLPFNVAACVTMRTGLAGRSFIGRTYLPGIPELYQSASLLTVGAYDAYNQAAEVFRQDVNAAGYVLGVYSQFTGGAPRAEGLFTPATSYAMADRVLDSQRGRKPSS